MNAPTMTTTDYDRQAWQTLAAACYANGHTPAGHRYSVAATRPEHDPRTYDTLMRGYRLWLVWNEFPY